MPSDQASAIFAVYCLILRFAIPLCSKLMVGRVITVNNTTRSF